MTNYIDKVMKEKRVYVIPKYVISETDWRDYFGVEDIDESEYGLISDNVWMDIAEKEGWVYTLEGFVRAWKFDVWFPSNENSYLRIIEVEIS